MENNDRKTLEENGWKMPDERLSSREVYDHLRYMRPHLPIEYVGSFSNDPAMRGMPQIILNGVQFLTPRHAMMLSDTPFDAHSESRYPEYGFTRSSLASHLENSALSKPLSTWGPAVRVDECGRTENVRCKECGAHHWDYHDYCVVCGSGINDESFYGWSEDVCDSVPRVQQSPSGLWNVPYIHPSQTEADEIIYDEWSDEMAYLGVITLKIGGIPNGVVTKHHYADSQQTIENAVLRYLSKGYSVLSFKVIPQEVV